MAKKYLIAAREHKCVGCNLCSLAAARYEKRKLGIKDSPISIKGRPGLYRVQIDYGVEIKNTDKIVKICPQDVFDEIVDQ